MKLSILAVLGVAATVRATEEVDTEVNELYKGPIGFPPGIVAPPPKFLPHKGPPVPQPLPIWHPPHKGVFIDDCDDDEDEEDWHWAWKKHGDKPHPGPPHKWITSTVTVTKTKTVGPPETTTEVSETICPVPITEEPPHPPKHTDYPAPEPTKEAPEPPVETAEPEPEPPAEEEPEEPEEPAPTEAAPAPPADESDEPNASSVPETPIESGAAPQNVAGTLAAVAALFAALF